MTDPYVAGSVWWGRIDFGDGYERKKYFILLSDAPASGDQAAIAMTTSRGNRYPEMGAIACGCPKYSCCRIDNGLAPMCFPEDTWVQFTDETRALSRARLDGLAKAGKAGFHGSLPEQQLRAILNCAARSLDIPRWALKLVELTHKAMSPARQPVKTRTPPPSAQTAFIGGGIMGISAQWNPFCTDCRERVAGAMQLTVGVIAGVLSGQRAEPDDFVKNAEYAFESLAESSSDGCTCSVSASR